MSILACVFPLICPNLPPCEKKAPLEIGLVLEDGSNIGVLTYGTAGDLPATVNRARPDQYPAEVIDTVFVPATWMHPAMLVTLNTQTMTAMYSSHAWFGSGPLPQSVNGSGTCTEVE